VLGASFEGGTVDLDSASGRSAGTWVPVLTTRGALINDQLCETLDARSGPASAQVVRMPFRLRELNRQPLRQLLRVRHPVHPKPQVIADLSTVVLDRPAGGVTTT
jgi:hypothetical protein